MYEWMETSDNKIRPRFSKWGPGICPGRQSCSTALSPSSPVSSQHLTFSTLSPASLQALNLPSGACRVSRTGEAISPCEGLKTRSPEIAQFILWAQQECGIWRNHTSELPGYRQTARNRSWPNWDPSREQQMCTVSSLAKRCYFSGGMFEHFCLLRVPSPWFLGNSCQTEEQST